MISVLLSGFNFCSLGSAAAQKQEKKPEAALIYMGLQLQRFTRRQRKRLPGECLQPCSEHVDTADPLHNSHEYSQHGVTGEQSTAAKMPFHLEPDGKG